MLYHIPDYYKEFRCTADRCEDTCCAGWQIVVDKQSLKKYKHIEGKHKKSVHKGIDWNEGVFRQDKEKRCAFLDGDNLCYLHRHLGEKSLCRTCRLYPRHIEEFENVREITLSVSCPEVARILLARKEPVKFLSYEKKGDETYEDFDELLYSMLLDAREVMLEIAQNREQELGERILLILGIAHDMERRMRMDNLFACGEVFETYQSERASDFVRQKLAVYEQNFGKRLKHTAKLFRKLYRLEVLRPDWRNLLIESEILLYKTGAEEYKKCCETFEQWMEQYLPEWKTMCEQLFVYFLYTYFCGAVYDGRVYGKVQMAAVSVLLITELWKAVWLRNGQTLDIEDMTQIVYRYSRELEHSDENLEQFECKMERTKIIVE